MGLRSRTNVVDEDRRSRPQGRVEEADLRVPLAVQDEQRKTWTGTPAARQRAMVEEIPSSSSAQLRQRESRDRGEIRELIGE